MNAFLSRIKRTVGSGGSRASSKSGGTAHTQPRAATTRKAKPGAHGGRSKATAASRPAAKSESGTKAGAKTGAKAGAGQKSRSKTVSRPKGAGKPGGSRPAAATKQADDGKHHAACQASDARHAPSAVVRVLAMLLAFVGMVVFAAALSRLTLEPSAASEAIAHTNLRPGSSIRAYLSQPAFQDTVKQLGGNIVLGVPFGVLLPVLIPRARGFVRVTAATAVVMLLVELVQGALITGRAFDVDDVILNSAGAFLGYLLLGRRLGRAVHPPRRRWWQRWIHGPAAG